MVSVDWLEQMTESLGFEPPGKSIHNDSFEFFKWFTQEGLNLYVVMGSYFPQDGHFELAFSRFAHNLPNVKSPQVLDIERRIMDETQDPEVRNNRERFNEIADNVLSEVKKELGIPDEVGIGYTGPPSKYNIYVPSIHLSGLELYELHADLKFCTKKLGYPI